MLWMLLACASELPECALEARWVGLDWNELGLVEETYDLAEVALEARGVSWMERIWDSGGGDVSLEESTYDRQGRVLSWFSLRKGELVWQAENVWGPHGPTRQWLALALDGELIELSIYIDYDQAGRDVLWTTETRVDGELFDRSVTGWLYDAQGRLLRSTYLDGSGCRRSWHSWSESEELVEFEPECGGELLVERVDTLDESGEVLTREVYDEGLLDYTLELEREGGEVQLLRKRYASGRVVETDYVWDRGLLVGLGETTLHYDDSGHLLRTEQPDGGQDLDLELDEQGRVVQHRYHWQDRLQRVQTYEHLDGELLLTWHDGDGELLVEAAHRYGCHP